jgi:tRNA-(ms[2]io[6]A)-hydroxylase
MLALRTQTPASWLDAVLSDFDAFLIDHAACERKASATGMAFVVRYPDRGLLLDPLIAFAREELEHFHRVFRILEQRGLRLGADDKDDYVRGLRAVCRTRGEEHLLDRLLTAGIVEARGCERFSLVAHALPDGELKDFYLDITRSESRHHALFVDLARRMFGDEIVRPRLDRLLDEEAEIVARLPCRAAVH